jgi:hypothetical protein
MSPLKSGTILDEDGNYSNPLALDSRATPPHTSLSSNKEYLEFLRLDDASGCPR